MSVIQIDETKCVGCNSCVRTCPSEDANRAYLNNDKRLIIKIDDEKCIKCGACIKACTHGARSYIDDTEDFFRDLNSGEETALIVAPAIKIVFGDEWKNVMQWFRQKGVKLIYDVSFGADICTWAHLRLLEKHPDAKIVSQPCAAIVNYILKHEHSVLKHLSPIHSPMMCTAIYMKNVVHFRGKIAAISPCIAKKDEFCQTGHVINYNVTMGKLKEYFDRNRIQISNVNSGFEFDGEQGFVGSIYPTPGGLKENLLLHKHDLGVINSEGVGKVYNELREYGHTEKQHLPQVFDVLNCEFGCNGGPGMKQDYNIFQTSASINKARQNTKKSREFSKKGADIQFEKFDKQLKLDDFTREYKEENIDTYKVSEAEINRVFESLGKHSFTEKHFDCHACGYKSCHDMAASIAKGLSVQGNCKQYTEHIMIQEKEAVAAINDEVAHMAEELNGIIISLSESISTVNEQAGIIAESGSKCGNDMNDVHNYMLELDEMNRGILRMMETIDSNVDGYSQMTKSVTSIAQRINLLALNASIESARAGEAGKAFAVVASNIRELSESSKQSVSSAKESEESIRGSIEGVNKTVSDFGENFVKLGELINVTRDNVLATSNNSATIQHSMEQVNSITEQIADIVKRTTELLTR